VMITRIQDDFSSKGLTSLHWNGPQVVALVCGPLARSSEPMPRMRFALCSEVIPAYVLPGVLGLVIAVLGVTVGTVPGGRRATTSTGAGGVVSWGNGGVGRGSENKCLSRRVFRRPIQQYATYQSIFLRSSIR
jgi:hypothetical protein